MGGGGEVGTTSHGPPAAKVCPPLMDTASYSLMLKEAGDKLTVPPAAIKTPSKGPSTNTKNGISLDRSILAGCLKDKNISEVVAG